MFQAITIPSKLLEYASLLAQIKEIKKYSVHSCSEKSAHTEETCKITNFTVTQINVHFFNDLQDCPLQTLYQLETLQANSELSK